jgi:hypothetical protein
VSGQHAHKRGACGLGGAFHEIKPGRAQSRFDIAGQCRARIAGAGARALFGEEA